jgi:CDP-2,3-bis-(O-geranylgeranyl)-sn-glycerol synthase
MVFTLWNLIESIWIILPAFAANGLATLPKGKRPIDGDRKFIDGKPILGKGKTWEGLITGVFVSTIIGMVQFFAKPYLPFDQAPIILDIAPMTPYLGFLLGLGAMLGDIAGSFIKRRLNLARGAPAPILDQDDFVVGALLFASLLVTIKFEWFMLLMVITPVIHLTANFIAFRLKIKSTPW